MLERFGRHITSKSLRRTEQRDVIARVFLDTKGHLSVEELHELVKKVNPRIGFATVYRTIRLLNEAGLAEARSFGDGLTRYEVSGKKKHHDHLICTTCGKIVEFENSQIEKLQEKVARQYGYMVTDHKLELYGQCPACAKPR